MNRNALRCLVLAVAAAVPAAADEFVLPILALQWPGKAGNQWNSEIFLTNPGPTTVTVTNGRFLPGTLRYDVQCFPPIAAFHLVAPYSTVLLPPQTLYLDLECPVAALGAMAFDADGPVVISSRVVNTFGLAPSEGVLAGLGQDLPAFATADLAGPGAVYQLPGLIWDPFRCGPPAFEIYLYLANPGGAPVVVTLQQSRDGAPGELVVNGNIVPTPYAVTVEAGAFLQLRVEPGGAWPAFCGEPQLVDLFFTATGGIAVVASDVDRSSQDARTVLPVTTSN
ncbi:MAG: hypothetical protein ABR961_15885 [Thermoanaerobaculaceae bacterium]|jgi:hypothetical protein